MVGPRVGDGVGQIAVRRSPIACHRRGTPASSTTRTVRRMVPPSVPPHRTDDHTGVEILRWPEDHERRQELRRGARPRLLLLAPDTSPPPPEAGEDWVWTPVDERDLASRLRRLARPATASGRPFPMIDDDGVLRTPGRLLLVPPVEAALLRCLAEQPGRVRSREDLRRAAWGGAPRVERSLDSRVLSLRRRIRSHHLTIVAVRGQGFVLDVVPGDGP